MKDLGRKPPAENSKPLGFSLTITPLHEKHNYFEPNQHRDGKPKKMTKMTLGFKIMTHGFYLGFKIRPYLGFKMLLKNRDEKETNKNDQRLGGILDIH